MAFGISANFEIPIVWTVEKATVVTIEMATGGEGNVDPLKCDLVAPLGAAWVVATQRVPVQSWAIHSKRKLGK